MKRQVFDCNDQLCGLCIDLCANCGRPKQPKVAAATTTTSTTDNDSESATPADFGKSLKAQSAQITSNNSSQSSSSDQSFEKSCERSLSRVAAWQHVVLDRQQDKRSDTNVKIDKSKERRQSAGEKQEDAEKSAKRRQQEECSDIASISEDVDGGYAWIILAAMFLINASTFGTARAYGLIFEKLARQDEQGRVEAALPFTIMGAIENMAGPLAGYLLARTNSWRITVLVGSSLLTISHLLAALYTSLLGQTLTIGLMCGLGLSLITISSFQINNAYFVRYRSRAFGFGLTGAVFGTLYITPICQYILDNCTTSACYLMLSIILFPNVPLALLLRPKRASSEVKTNTDVVGSNTNTNERRQENASSANRVRLWPSIKQVIGTPHFHLIWPTQLLFCWFNFVYGMIIVDFGYDRGLEAEQCSRLIPIWALGQLVGRVVLGFLVDLKLISYRCFTVICFGFISAASWALISVKGGPNESWQISLLVFTVSVFVALLYILFNGLMFGHMHESLTALSLGISSFAGSFFLLPRANIIGYYRDQVGSYDPMLSMFASVSLLAALMWTIMPEVFAIIEHWKLARDGDQCQALARACSMDAERDSVVENGDSESNKSHLSDGGVE